MRFNISLKSLQMLFCAALLLTSSSLWAGQASRAQIDALIQVAQAREMFSTLGPLMEAQTNAAMKEVVQSVGLEGAQKQRFDQAVAQRLLPQLRNEVSWQQLEPMIRDVFTRVFDAEDAEAAARFHQTPAGQSHRRAAMALMNDPNFMTIATNTQQLQQFLQQQMSAADIQAMQEFQNSASGQRIQTKMQQALPEVMQSMQSRIGNIVQNFLMQELPQS